MVYQKNAQNSVDVYIAYINYGTTPQNGRRKI